MIGKVLEIHVSKGPSIDSSLLLFFLFQEILA